MPQASAPSWTFDQPSPLGTVRSSFEISAEGLCWRCDGPLQRGNECLRWEAIAEACTAVVDLPAGQGGPDMPRWMPGRLEWLLVSRRDGRGRAFMRPLPPDEAREALVAELRQRLGARWVGERVPLRDAQRRFRISGRGDMLKVAALVGSVLALLFALLVLAAFLSSPVFALPATAVLGGWCLRRGLTGLRDALKMRDTPTSRVMSAALGLVELQGCAVTDSPSAAGASGRPSVWWDMAVDVWYEDSRGKGGQWRQVLARYGGEAQTLLLQDDSGRLPVWLRDADLLLSEHCWESGKDALPAPGLELLRAAGLGWQGRQRLRVRERRMEAGGPLYVLGTLDEARHLPAAEAPEGGLQGLLRSLRTGRWRQALVHAVPGPLRMTVTITLAYLDMLFGLGRGGEQTRQPRDAAVPPALAPSALLVWKGRAGRAFIVSDRRETEALAQLRKRSLVFIALGIGVLSWCLHEVLQFL
jgi:hypothetical protein